MANDVNMIIQLIQVAIGYRKQLSQVLSEKEWWQLHEQSKLQAVAGVCLAGVGKLPKEQWPMSCLEIKNVASFIAQWLTMLLMRID